jgi:hypothetical protein
VIDQVTSPGTCPCTICLDPLGAGRHSPRQWQIENRDSLAQASARADRNDLSIVGELDSPDRNAKARNLSFEWRREMLFEHGEKACALLLVVIRIDDRIDGALGELSPFHRTHGFYVHGVSIESATLPSNWQLRTVPVSGRGARESTGYCMEGHDLAASKLVAFREKDRESVRVLLDEKMGEALVVRDLVVCVASQSRSSHASRVAAQHGRATRCSVAAAARCAQFPALASRSRSSSNQFSIRITRPCPGRIRNIAKR